MSKILTEKARLTQIDATATSGEYTYDASYSFNSEKELLRLQVNINKNVLEAPSTYCGFMSLDQGARNMNFPSGIDNDIVAHVTMFENILAEVKSDLEEMI